LGAIPELVHEVETGLLFCPEVPDDLPDKVNRAWTHPVRMNEMGSEAKK
jgi:hypothetical protein